MHKFWEPSIEKYGPIEIPPEYDDVDCSEHYCFDKEEMESYNEKRKKFLDEKKQEKLLMMERILRNKGKPKE